MGRRVRVRNVIAGILLLIAAIPIVVAVLELLRNAIQ